MILTITFPECRPQGEFFNSLQQAIEAVCDNVERTKNDVVSGILTFKCEVKDSNDAESAILRGLRRYAQKLKIYDRDKARELLMKVEITIDDEARPVGEDEAEEVLKVAYDS